MGKSGAGAAKGSDEDEITPTRMVLERNRASSAAHKSALALI
jgi:hypothetical protein